MTIPSKNWGGQRAGAGRPSTGRKKYNFYITDEEHQLLKQYLEQLRSTKSDKAANSIVNP